MPLKFGSGLAIVLMGITLIVPSLQNPSASPAGSMCKQNRSLSFCHRRYLDAGEVSGSNLDFNKNRFDDLWQKKLPTFGQIPNGGTLAMSVLWAIPNGSSGGSPVDSILNSKEADSFKTQEERSQFVGYTMLGSGLFLCSWGIVSWQISEYQDCPPRNTDNVIKIVAGILLINAGLFYLFGGCD